MRYNAVLVRTNICHNQQCRPEDFPERVFTVQKTFLILKNLVFLRYIFFLSFSSNKCVFFFYQKIFLMSNTVDFRGWVAEEHILLVTTSHMYRF